jgi:NAD(P)-dependent dehydrogenase (short-subunit alcohol dehydrogenase family)
MARLEGQVALITGAGSGVGRAAALALAAEGAAVALAGRTEATLHETAAMIATRPGCPPERVLVVPCDVTVPAQVHDMVSGVRRRLSRLDILVNNAGLNVPRRSLAEMDVADWERIVATNLDGAFLCVHAVLPIMRAQSGGTLIHIGSQAARRPSTLAGAAYTAAKAGLTGLSAVINAEERRHGIRSSLLILGDVDTPLLDQRPAPPPAAARALALQPEDVAACVVLIATLPGRVTVEELALLPTWGG